MVCSCSTIRWRVSEYLSNGSLSGKQHNGRRKFLLASDFDLICPNNILRVREVKWHDRSCLQTLTWIIMTSADWKRVVLAAGTQTDALDWYDWNSPLISLPEAKLLWKRTCRLSEKGVSAQL